MVSHVIYSLSEYLLNNRFLTYEYAAYNIWPVKFKCAIISLVLQFITTGLELLFLNQVFLSG